jgi:hypoxanthine phosphoribosyltransferase
MVEKAYITYNQVHKLCQQSAAQILSEVNPNLIIAIGGGGYVPARILRSFLKSPGKPNIPIQAIGLSLYEDLSTSDATEDDNKVEEAGVQVTRTQWLDLSRIERSSLVGKRILIIDEVDDTRTTLEYAVSELKKDIKAHSEKEGGNVEGTSLAVFVLHVSLYSGCFTGNCTANGKFHRIRTRPRKDRYQQILNT